tara:strand:+ start:2081 stop:4021 length:1941 start_codon:yes stop_codon:yes gene_type:complete
MDLTKLSYDDLIALQSGDLTKVSEAGLAIISGEKVVEQPVPAKKLTREEAIAEITSFPRAEQMQIGSAKDLGRQIGLTGRAALTGALSLPTIGADALTGLINILAGRQVMKPSSQGLQDLMTQIGVPTPQTSQERIVQDVTSAGFGVAGPASLGKYLPKPAQDFFTKSLETQGAASVGGALASGAARESDVGPVGQTLGALAGATTAGGAVGSAPVLARTTREIVRPFTEAGREVITGNVLRNLASDAEQAIKAGGTYVPKIGGYTPTTAQATRDIGLINAETAIKGLDVTKGRFATQALEANQAQMAILNRLAKDDDVLKAAYKKRDEVADPLRENAFANSTVTPEIFQSGIALTVNKTIDDILASPVGKRQTVMSVMKDAKDDIARATTPAELYEIRKDLRAKAQGLLDKSEGGGPTAGAFKAAKPQLESVIRSVDDAIEAGATGYKDYLSKYAASSKGIERLEAAQEFKGKVLSTTPDPSRVNDYLISQPAFTRAIRAAEKETNLSSTQLAVLKRVAEDLDSGVLPRATKVAGSDTFKNMSTANVIGGMIGKQMFGDVPLALQKVSAPMNWLYNGTDDAIRELLVNAMLDPKLAASLMKKASTTTVEPLSKELQRKALQLGYGATFGLTEKPYRVDLTGMANP